MAVSTEAKNKKPHQHAIGCRELLKMMGNSPGNDIDLSVVVPVYEERDNVRPLYSAIKEVLENLQKPYEIIFTDDGSKDGTRDALKEIAGSDDRFRVILCRRNFGQSAAMAAGFKLSKGRIVISLDGDLQNDPRDIPRLLEKMEEGYDVISGWRKDRKDKWLLRRVPSILANRLICSVTGVRLHDTGCALKAFRKEVIEKIRLYGELHRFIPALARVEGARIAEIEVRHHPRRFGRSKYNLSRTFRVMMDLSSLNIFLKYLRNPLRFFGKIGFVFLFIGFLGMCWVGYYMGVHRTDLIELNIPVTLIFLLWVAGFQFLFLGLVAALIVKTGSRFGFTMASMAVPNTEGRDDS
jgi:glycosyltransferase involved in cell wall biosynthesis